MALNITELPELPQWVRRAFRLADQNFQTLESGSSTAYDNTSSGLTATTVQGAIDELAEGGTSADSVTIVRNTSVPGQTSFDAQTAVILQLAEAYVVNSAVTTKQNDYNPTGMDTAREISWRGAGSTGITGLAGGAPGRQIVITNDTTDYLLWLEHENTSSTAANRIQLPKGFPAFLMPGDSITLRFSEWINRWKVQSWPNQGAAMGLTEFTDFVGGVVGPFSATLSGAGTVTASSLGIDATEKAKGVIAINTGTGTTDRASVGTNATGTLAPTLGPMLAVLRVAVSTATDGTQTFTGYFGFTDSSGGTLTDGACYEYRWSGSAAEWNYIVADATSITRAASAVTLDATYKWFVIFVNADGTRVDFIRCEDSMAFTKEASVTTDLPEVGDVTAFGASVIKSAGTTSRSMAVDFMGYRADGARG